MLIMISGMRRGRSGRLLMKERDNGEGEMYSIA